MQTLQQLRLYWRLHNTPQRSHHIHSRNRELNIETASGHFDAVFISIANKNELAKSFAAVLEKKTSDKKLPERLQLFSRRIERLTQTGAKNSQTLGFNPATRSALNDLIAARLVRNPKTTEFSAGGRIARAAIAGGLAGAGVTVTARLASHPAGHKLSLRPLVRTAIKAGAVNAALAGSIAAATDRGDHDEPRRREPRPIYIRANPVAFSSHNAVTRRIIALSREIDRALTNGHA